jgi:hypothetical protein
MHRHIVCAIERTSQKKTAGEMIITAENNPDNLKNGPQRKNSTLETHS